MFVKVIPVVVCTEFAFAHFRIVHCDMCVQFDLIWFLVGSVQFSSDELCAEFSVFSLLAPSFLFS